MRAVDVCRRTAAAVLAVAAIAVLLPAAARAQDATGSVTLTRQTPWRLPDQPFSLTVRIRTSSPTSGLEVAIGTYRRMRSRSEFQNAIEGRLPTRTPIDLTRTPVDALARDAAGNATVSLTPRVTQEGVYPVRVELRESDGGNVVDGFTTFMVSLAATIDADPIDVAVVFPVHAPPALQPNGKTDLSDDRATALVEMAAAIAARPAVPVTLLPTPETLDALAVSTRAADRDGVTTLGRVAAANQVVASTYVPVDRSALLQQGLGAELDAQRERGIAAVRETLDTTPSSDVLVTDQPLDAEALTAAKEGGVEGLVVPERHLERVRLPNGITLTGLFDLGEGDGRVRSAAADEALAAHFLRDVPAPLGAAHLLADLTVLWLDRPGRAVDRRGVVALPPSGWRPNAVFAERLLEGLTQNPVLAPVTLDTFFDEVGTIEVRRRVMQREFVDVEARERLSAGTIRDLRRRLGAFTSLASEGNETVASLDRSILVSESSDLRPRDRARHLRSIADRLRDRFSSVTMPEQRSITLTAREGELPITIRNGLPYPITVVLTLDSDTLDFPGGSSRTVELTRENTTERFAVHARGSGSFPVRVSVSTPGGGVMLAQSRFTVRSTAVSGVGVALSAGAALFLVVWWASHLRGRRGSAGEPVE